MQGYFSMSTLVEPHAHEKMFQIRRSKVARLSRMREEMGSSFNYLAGGASLYVQLPPHPGTSISNL